MNTNDCIRDLRVLGIKRGGNMTHTCLYIILMIGIWASLGLHTTQALDLTVLHLNDIHARIEQTNKYLGYCKPKDVGK